MEFGQLQNILKNDKNVRFVIFDAEGKATHVVLPFSEYERMTNLASNAQNLAVHRVTEIKPDIQAGFESRDVSDLPAENAVGRSLRIEDLPF